ncbi:MAG: trehalose-6-phosphate synthase, partial [Dehalococcoidia bacterium]|nr:trehalose-6-phosphate synthase [Dehalococcoidia bacterium]
MATVRKSLTWPLAPLLELGQVDNALEDLLAHKRIILASNRGPVQYTLNKRGELTAQRGQGGLVSALTSLLRYAKVSWVASSMSAGDREAARLQDNSPQGCLLDDPLRLRLVNVAARTYRRHYQVFANPVLWLVQHSLADTLEDRPASLIWDAWRRGYLPVNRYMAGAILKELSCSDTVPWVFLHDYQLYMVGHFI